MLMARIEMSKILMGDEINKFSRSPRFERSEFSMSPDSRQIYLTFPADSTFREEDVSSYFSNYGPVQDVRIPYQQKLPPFHFHLQRIVSIIFSRISWFLQIAAVQSFQKVSDNVLVKMKPITYHPTHDRTLQPPDQAWNRVCLKIYLHHQKLLMNT
ncbi:hypothetical protein POM88_007428 [Heracleum sosnowskyi]|uniref:RRM domain-containing protein n=1 Tax=Heracleum sosnowskyi TaxID=360622 RepID=A0AAD8J4D6_9APIA|nr:hypothetical protein POM88_007428 [Heracleum sosnowskyi]